MLSESAVAGLNVATAVKRGVYTVHESLVIYDFAGILNGYGEFFLRRFDKTYPEIESFWERIWFYKGTFALLEALFGIENNDKEAFSNGIEAYM